MKSYLNITLGIANHNGRIYDSVCFTGADKPLKESIGVFADTLSEMDLKFACGIVHKIGIEDNRVYVDWDKIDTWKGNVLSKIIDEHVIMAPIGTGHVDKDGHISEYTLQGFVIIS